MTFLGFISYKCGEKIQEHFFSLEQKTHTFDSLQIEIEINELDEDFNVFKIILRPDTEKNISLNKFWLQSEFHFSAENRILCNGFQSWTETDEFEIDHKIERPRKALKGIFKAFGDYEFVNLSGKKGDLHSWTYSYIRKKAAEKEVLFFGSLNEKSGYTLIRYETSKNLLFLAKDCEGLLLEKEYEIADFFVAETNEEAATNRYFEAFYEKNAQIDISKQGAEVGWTSWYNYYANIDEKIILDNLNAFASRKVPIDIFQIDDGWQESVGDWTKVNKKFPNGLRYITDKIHENGYQAGLWLAPFICQKQSFIYKNHFDWLQKDEKGKPIKASFNAIWKSWMYPLDIYNEEVRTYLKEFFDTVLKDWNFDMVKLDFLYAIAFRPTKDKTRGQIMCEGIALLRELVGDKLILGCGVPLGPSLGMFNYCRIGADVHLSWEMNILKWMGSRERVSTICALKNTVHRRHLNG
ncbi:MAG: glycoside hydrolase family 36 protein, partial [Chitinophagales bacterium]